ncbi:Phosphoadenosine phosphosulfate reductase [Streptomyces tendae]
MDAYVAEHGVLTNPLLMNGYASVGCAPCTRRVAGEARTHGPAAGPDAARTRHAGCTAR